MRTEIDPRMPSPSPAHTPSPRPLAGRRPPRPAPRPRLRLPCPTCLALVLLLTGSLPAPAAVLSIAAADPAAHPSRRAMQRWHARYAPRAHPVRSALVGLLTARHEPRFDRWEPGVREACERLGSRLAAFGEEVRQGQVFPIPDRPSDYHLKRAYAALDEAVRACGRRDYGAMEAALHRAGESLRQAEGTLARYGLRP